MSYVYEQVMPACQDQDDDTGEQPQPGVFLPELPPAHKLNNKYHECNADQDDEDFLADRHLLIPFKEFSSQESEFRIAVEYASSNLLTSSS